MESMGQAGTQVPHHNGTVSIVTVAAAVMASSIAVFVLALTGLPSYILLLPLALCVAFSIVRSAGFAVIIFTILIYMNASAVLANSHGIRILGDLMVLMMAMTVSVHFLSGKKVDHIIIPAVACAVYLISLAATALYARSPDAVLAKVGDSAKICVMTLMLISLIDSMRQFHKMCVAIVLAAMMTSFLTVIQYLYTGYSKDFWGFALASVEHVAGHIDGWRPSGPLTDPNFYAQILVIALPLALQIMVSGASRRYALYGMIASVLIMIALLLTLSRGGLLGAAASILVLVIINRRRITKKHMMIALLVGGVGLFALPSHYMDRFNAGMNSLQQIASGGFGKDPAVAGRASELLAALYVAQKHTLIGVGYGEFMSYYQEISISRGLMARGADRQTHSLYLEVLSERGIVGILFFSALLTLAVTSLLKALSYLRKQRRIAAENAVGAWGAAMVGYLSTSIFLHEGYAQYSWLLFITAMALPTIVLNSNFERKLLGRVRV